MRSSQYLKMSKYQRCFGANPKVPKRVVWLWRKKKKAGIGSQMLEGTKFCCKPQCRADLRLYRKSRIPADLWEIWQSLAQLGACGCSPKMILQVTALNSGRPWMFKPAFRIALALGIPLESWLCEQRAPAPWVQHPQGLHCSWGSNTKPDQL